MRAQTVLIADDDDDSRMIYATYLRHRGYAVLEARDAAEALSLARARRPDAAVLDFHMPGPRVPALLAALRAERPFPALVLSADVRRETRDEAEAAGCARFLLKPLEPRDLASALEAALAEAPAPAPLVIRLSPESVRALAAGASAPGAAG